MTYVLAAVGNFTQFFDDIGRPLNGGRIYTYAAGSSSILQQTYSTRSGVANPNPIVLDSNGRSPTAIWLDPTLAYNFVLTRSDGTTVLETTDNVTNVITNNEYTAGTGIAISDLNVISNTGLQSVSAGTGISATTAAGVVTVSNTGILTVTGGTGISATTTAGAVSLANTGVTQIVAGTNVSIDQGTGSVTISAAGGGGSEPLNQVVYGTGTGIDSSADFSWNDSTKTMTVGSGTADVFLQSRIVSQTAEPGVLRITGSRNNNTGVGLGGSVRISAGQASGSGVGGTVTIVGGINSSTGAGGDITLLSGNNTANLARSGNVAIETSQGGEFGTTSPSGNIDIRVGNARGGNSAGALSIKGGDLVTSGTGVAGAVIIAAGNAGSTAGVGGNVSINGGLGTNTDSGGYVRIQTAVAKTLVERMRITNAGVVEVAGNTLAVRTPRTPASSSAAGVAGDICWDADYIYVCTATNTWKRTPILTW